jgi:hypothetical protein
VHEGKNVAESFVKNTPVLALSHKRTVYRIVERYAVTASLLDRNKLQRHCVKVLIFQDELWGVAVSILRRRKVCLEAGFYHF